MGVQTRFKKGQSGNLNGRPLGAKNKIRYDLHEILNANKCNPIEILAQIATANFEALKLTEEQIKYFSVRIRMEAAAELMQYIMPKLKALELSTGPESPVEFTINLTQQK